MDRNNRTRQKRIEMDSIGEKQIEMKRRKKTDKKGHTWT